jgi:phospholipid/cholesterol/gamma-HCH transport system permease protein
MTNNSAHNFATSFGAKMLGFAQGVGSAGLLTGEVVRDLFRRPLHFVLIVEQVYNIGVKSLGLILVTSVSTGMVMALQFGLGLEKFGGKLYVPKIVSLSILREMGPVFCSLMLAARVGAGIASELGSMTVTQQIDAIRALGTSPIKRIIIPRVLGCLIAVPLLAAIGNLAGILGSLIVGVSELGLDPLFYYQKVIATCTITDYITGIGKTFFFALFISLTACWFGLNVRGGTRGVGEATTRAVVYSSVMVLVGDFFLTKLFYILLEK